MEYLNTDLELASRVDLTALVAALEAGGVAPLTTWQTSDGQFHANLETDEQHDHPEPNIGAMLAVVESLSPALRAAWDACTKRELDLGYASAPDAPARLDQGLSADLLRRIVAAGASLRITLYAASH